MSKMVGISLGNVCYTADWAIAQGYRQKRSDGYRTCVFDLMISHYKGIVQCILEDFRNFCNPNFLSWNGVGSIVNTYYNFEFNHETPGHADLHLKEMWPEGANNFINNNYKHFISRYQRRIQNFKNYLNDTNNTIVFAIQFARERNPNDDFKDLRQALALKYPHLNYTIIVV